MPVSPDREYRTAQLLECRKADAEEESYIVEGYATTFDDPYVLYDDGQNVISERIARNALDNADMSDVIMQYDHAGKVYARQSNGTLQIMPDDHGIKIRADLSKSQGARDLYEEIRNGLITKMSWAFTVADEEFDKQTHTRTVKAIKKMYDVSAVSIPANPQTEISARDYANGVLEAERAERMELEKAKARIRILLEVKS